MRNLFAYGTLMVPAVMQAVTGQSFRQEPATLTNYVRCWIKRQVYPGIFAAANHTVHGLIYFDIDERSLQRLDEFESEVYERREVHGQLTGGDTVIADAYIVATRYEHLLGSESWDLDQFKEQYLQAYLSSLKYIGSRHSS